MSVHSLPSRPWSRLLRMVEERDWKGLHGAFDGGASPHLICGNATLLEHILRGIPSEVADDRLLSVADQESLRNSRALLECLAPACVGGPLRSVSPMVRACASGRPDLVAALLAVGISPNQAGTNGIDAIEAFAAQRLPPDPDLAGLRQHPAMPFPWVASVQSKRFEPYDPWAASINLLAAAGAELNRPRRHGASPLALAVLAKDRRAVRTLLGAGASPTGAPSADAHGVFAWTPLEAAWALDDHVTALDLIVAGAALDRATRLPGWEGYCLRDLTAALGTVTQLDAVFWRGGRPLATAWLGLALRRGHAPLAEACLALGADPTDRDHQGRDGGHHAAEGGSAACVALVRARAVDMDRLDRHGWSAWAWLEHRHPAMAERARLQPAEGGATVLAFRKPRR